MGTPLDINLHAQKDKIKKYILRYVGFISNKVRGIDAEVREHLLTALVRSLLIYHGTPMVAAGLWKRKEIDKIEIFMYREAAKITNQISNNAIMNILQYLVPSWETIK